MIEYFNFQQLTSSNQIPGHLDVGLAGRWVSAWMIVTKTTAAARRGSGQRLVNFSAGWKRLELEIPKTLTAEGAHRQK